MSEQPPNPPGQAGPLRTLAVRLSDDLRAQLDVLAALNLRSVSEEIRIGLESWVERSMSDPSVLRRAETVRADIEREAQTRCNAIEAIFAASPPPVSTKARPPKQGELSS